MKKYLIAIVLLVAFLVVFVPLASSNPDGLEKVVQSFGGQEQKPIWAGLMSDYSISFIGNSYLETLFTGIIGVVLVLCAGLILSRVFNHDKKTVDAK